MTTSVRHQGGTPTTVMIVVDDGTEVVVGRMDARRPDLTFVDALVRLQLTARRRGWLIQIRDVSEELRALLDFVGLAEVLPLEPRREPELGEQLGIQEVVQSDDPPA
jgi:hypothetical protein